MKLLIIFTLLFTLNAHAIPFEGHKLLISGPSPHAVDTARKIAAQGGNVVDVAVAVALTLSVTSPYYASLGGGGLAMVKMDGPVETLDFREAAPLATGKAYFKDLPKDASFTGGNAVAVPGVPAGLVALHQRYGKLKWPVLFNEALRLAREGFAVSGEWVQNSEGEKARFNDSGREAFFRKNSISYLPGEVLKQPSLAQALTALRDNKLKGFYEGDVAKDLVKSVNASGGTLSLLDLKSYKVRWFKPLVTDFEGYKIYLMPPPSSGGVVVYSALKMMEKLDLKSRLPLSVDELHLLAEIEARSFRARTLLGDPEFVKNPLEMLLGEPYLNKMVQSIDLKKSVPLESLPEANEKKETTHFSVMDSDGHAVALTVTLNGMYGSALVTNRFHIVLNDEMEDFTTKPGEANVYHLAQGLANAVEPGKRPLSSMTPTLVEHDGKIMMSLGAPGGPGIISGVLQVLYRVLAQNLDIDSAIQFPRVHHQFLPRSTWVDAQRLSPETLKALRDRGHEMIENRGSTGKVYAVRLRTDGVLEAAFDARGEGAAGGN